MELVYSCDLENLFFIVDRLIMGGFICEMFVFCWINYYLGWT